MTRILLFIFLIFSYNINHAQSLQELTDSVNFLQNKQDYLNALKWAELVLTKSEKEFGKNDTNYISALRKLVEINFIVKNNDKALEYGKLDSERTQSVYGENSIKFAETLLNLSQIYINKQKLVEAEQTAFKSSELYKKLLSQFDPKYADALKILAWIYKNENKGVEASQTYYKILQSIKENYGIMNASYAETVTNLTEALESKGFNKDSEELLIKTLNEYKAINVKKSNNYGYACLDLGRVYKRMGRELESEIYLNEGLQILIPVIGENNDVIMNSYFILAYNNSLTNKYDKSEELYKKILSFKKQKQGENNVEYAYILSKLGMLYRTMSRFKEGEELCKKSIEIMKKIKMEKNSFYSNILNSLAEIYINTGKYDECLKLYDECINIEKNNFGDDFPDKEVLLNNRAELYKNMGKYKESEIMFQQALNLLEKKSGKNNARYAWYLNNLAEVLEFNGYYEFADSMYKDVLQLRKVYRGEYHPEYAETIGFLARLSEKKRDFENADKYFLQALDIYLRNIKLTFPSLSETEKSYFYGPMKSFFEHFCSYVSKRAKSNPNLISELYNYRIKTKFLLYNSSKKVRENIINSGDTVLINKFNEWHNLRDLLAMYYNLSKEQISQKGINIDSINLAANSLEKEISSKSEEFTNEYEKKDYNWIDIRNTLNNDEAAVEIIRFRNFGDIKNSYNPNVNIPGFLDSVVYAALIITKKTLQNPSLILLNNGNQIEKNFAVKYADCIQKLRNSKNEESDSNLKDITENELSEVYESVWKKINSQLKGINIVYISLDGIYNKININTLFDSDTKHYVIEEKDIRILTTTPDIIRLKLNHKYIRNTAELFGNPKFNLEPDSLKLIAELSNSSGKPELFRMANDADSLVRSGISQLQGTEKEVNAINDALKNKGWEVKESISPDANEDAVKSVQNPRILHLATHGKFLRDVDIEKKRTSGLQTRQYSENPLLRSFLIFAGAENIIKDMKNNKFKNDGLLTAYEAMNLNLDSTELVVLSACETGLGEIRNGEGVYGLQRAFQTAGAKTIIMSLWNVLDEPTQELMTLFYDNWLSGKSKRNAFREAQLKLKEKYNNVYIWGGFVMVGE
ncbi:MAG: CHAT domain-containing protein [Ignavibacteriae bacterium]|nr:CHAT domain-containing protein [Ignavibacteriota bacterium]